MTTNPKGWKAQEAAQHHLKTANILTPYRPETIALIARLATESFSEEPKILDVGCGYGDVTAEILELRPQASICMVDFSDEMIKLTEERFGDNPRVEVLKYDLNEGIPEILAEGTFDAVVSAYTLHHVDYDKRAPLYRHIRRILTARGIFAVVDRFKSESPCLMEWEFDNWIEWMSGQVKEHLDKEVPFSKLKQRQMDSDIKPGNKPGAIWEMRRDLKEAGFTYVDCLWKSYNMALMAGVNR